ncbi:AAA family ATPase [Sphaerisporangium dianthi]|uniref:AAA family ATPase n=1 Tax=Sphaerisporangium dianthi TaxID=1436120 RepID=A0ABV9CUW4_9ACTN
MDEYVNGGEFQPMSLDEASQAAEMEESFVVEDVITTGTTLLYGEPDAGKSLMTSGLIKSLVTGEPFLGRTVNGTRTVAVCWSDDRAYAEYAQRIRRVLPEGYGERVRFYQMPIMKDAGMWDRLFAAIQAHGHDMVIFDVLSQMIDGDINDGPPVARFFDGVRKFTRKDIPALVLAHSSEKRGQNGKSDLPMGHTSIRGYSRMNIFLSRAESGIWTARVKGKWADTSMVTFMAPDFDVPRFKVLEEKDGRELRGKARERSTAVMNDRAEKARWIAENCQGVTTKKEVQERLAKRFRMKTPPNLSKPEWTSLVRQDGGDWTLVGPLAA